jgi:hypothetical protein
VFAAAVEKLDVVEYRYVWVGVGVGGWVGGLMGGWV